MPLLLYKCEFYPISQTSTSSFRVVRTCHLSSRQDRGYTGSVQEVYRGYTKGVQEVYRGYTGGVQEVYRGIQGVTGAVNQTCNNYGN